MTMVQPIALASDRVMAALRSGLELEFGRGAGAALAARFLEAEETDIRWDARARERWVGAYLAQEDDLELDRIAATGFLGWVLVRGHVHCRWRWQCPWHALLPELRLRRGGIPSLRADAMTGHFRRDAR